MDATNLNYPVICFSDDLIEVYHSPDDLTTTYVTTLKTGWFEHMLLVDGSGKAVRVKGARKVSGAGWKWIGGPFVLRRAKIELEFEGELFGISLDEIKEHTRHSRIYWKCKEEADDYEETVEGVNSARSVAELAQALAARPKRGW